MSKPAQTDFTVTLSDEPNQFPITNGAPANPGALPFLLQPEPEAIVEVELVNHPVKLPHHQFEALLIDSECEV